MTAYENGSGQRAACARYADGERAARANLRAGVDVAHLAASCPPGAPIDWTDGYRDEANRLAQNAWWADLVRAGGGS